MALRLVVWAVDRSDNSRLIYKIGIHSFMYTYYALAAIGWKFPKIVSMILTTIQTLQMAIGLLLTRYWLSNCTDHPDRLMMILSTMLFAPFGILFANYFLRTYILNEKKSVNEGWIKGKIDQNCNRQK